MVSIIGTSGNARITLVLVGTINGTRNAFSNVLTGNGAADHLAGGTGHDTLTGSLAGVTSRLNHFDFVFGP